MPQYRGSFIYIDNVKKVNDKKKKDLGLIPKSFFFTL